MKPGKLLIALFALVMIASFVLAGCATPTTETEQAPTPEGEKVPK